MATPQFSVYTPQGLGTVPPATIGQNFLPAFGQGLLQVAKTYQARKSVEEAADQASTLFGDPTYGNIFRQMGLAAVAQGESPTPIINSMLSTAITLKRDADQRQQQEQMARLQFGQQTAMENLRTQNNLKEFGARTAYAEEQGSANAIAGRRLNELTGTATADNMFSTSNLGQWAADAQRAEEDRKREANLQDKFDSAAQAERGRLEARSGRGLSPDGDGDVEAIIRDSGVKNIPASQLSYAELEEQENLILTAGGKGKDVESALNDRLRAIQEQKRILLDKDKREEQKDLKAPKTKPSPAAASKYDKSLKL
jgi:hypothetical protein